MYVILVYDVGEERVAKVLRICRKYLTWVQNSVFEGEISESRLMLLLDELREEIAEKDSITVYKLRTTAYLEKERLGSVKGEPSSFL
ncbi:MAG: CRISPR-associated endonuclease Cas2 [Nitrososphaeria archaeon]